MRSAGGISVVIPVLNERGTIGACLTSLRAIEGGRDCEVIVVDGDPGASTLAALDDPGAIALTAPAGRASQMNAGAERARGGVLLFLHADTFLPADAFERVARTLGDPAVVGGAFAHRFDSPRPIYRAVSVLVSHLTRWNRMPYGDQAIFLRREYFERIGGFAPIEIMEDHELVARIRRRGDRLRVLDVPVRTSARRLEAEGIGRRIFMNWAMTVMFHLGVPPRRLARYYRPPGGE